MNRLSALIITLLAVVILFATGCKKNNDNGGTPNPTTADFFVDVDFLPIEETNGEAAPRLMANINDEVVMIELRRPSTGTPIETVLLLGPDNITIMLCGNDSLMICAAYDIETNTPSDDVIMVTYMDDNTLLLTQCVMDWETNTMTTGDMMVLPINESSKNLKETHDIDGEIRSFFFNRFVKQLAERFEKAEHFCGVLGSPAGAVFASLRLIITTELTTILYSDDPEELYDHTTQSFTSTVANLVQTGLLNMFKNYEFGMASRILAAIGWKLDGGHGAVNDYNGYTGSDIIPNTLVISQAYHYMSAGQVVKPDPLFYVNMNVSNITETSAYFKGTFRFGNTSMPPVEMGYIYSVNGGPEYIEEDMDFHGITLTGLKKATKYKVRAYVKALMTDPVFSPEITFWTLGFEAFPKSLNFPAEGDTKYTTLLYSPEDITGWDITSCPSWCTTTTDDLELLSVTADPSEETRNGIITITGYSKALGTMTQNITVTQQGSNSSGFFAGTPFNNTRWDVPLTSNATYSFTIRESEYHYNPNGNSYYTYYTENHTESVSISGNITPTFKGDILRISDNLVYEFKGDSIIINETNEYGVFTTRCLNNVEMDIHNLYGFTTYNEGTAKVTRYFIGNNTFCIKTEFHYSESNNNGANYWCENHITNEILEKFVITDNNQCSYNVTSSYNMTADYGSEFTGIIQQNNSCTVNGSGNWEYGVNDNIVISRNKSSDFTVIPKIPMKKRD